MVFFRVLEMNLVLYKFLINIYSKTIIIKEKINSCRTKFLVLDNIHFLLLLIKRVREIALSFCKITPFIAIGSKIY